MSLSIKNWVSEKTGKKYPYPKYQTIGGTKPNIRGTHPLPEDENPFTVELRICQDRISPYKMRLGHIISMADLDIIVPSGKTASEIIMEAKQTGQIIFDYWGKTPLD